MNTTEIFLIALLIIFTAPYLLWRLGRTDYWAPLVVVQIVGGILLGALVSLVSYIATWSTWEVTSRIDMAKKLREAKTV